MPDCLFCRNPDDKYRPVKDVDYVCANCVQLLCGADQDDLKKAHAKAIERGFLDKANALESFIIPEGKEYEQRRPTNKEKIRRHFARKRGIGATRGK